MPQIPTNILDSFTAFKTSCQAIQPSEKRLSLNYTKEREFLLQANVCRLKSLKQLEQALPSYVTQVLDAPTQADFGLTELCLPQVNNYDGMPEHKWVQVRQRLAVCCDAEDICELIDECESRYLFISWYQLREALMMLGRKQLRKALWGRVAHKVPEKENFPLITEILDEEEAQELKEVYWVY